MYAYVYRKVGNINANQKEIEKKRDRERVNYIFIFIRLIQFHVIYNIMNENYVTCMNMS